MNTSSKSNYTPANSTIYASVVMLLVSMTSITAGASLAKHLFPVFGAPGTTSLRLGVAAILLAAITRPWRFRLSREALIPVVGYGFCLASMNTLFYMSIARIPIGIAIAIEFTGPLTLALISSRKAIDFLWIILAVTGIVLLLPHSQWQAPLDHLGVAYALAAAVLWAAYILLGKRASSLTDPQLATSIGVIVGALTLIPFGIETPAVLVAQPSLILSVIGVGILSSALPYSLEMRALRNFPTKTFGIFMSLEPAIGAVAGFLILSETLTYLQLFAIGFIMAASMGSAVTAARKR